ncbi:MAG: sigma-70 family RNA polymerase sigma factor, partial [bacterium]|nr:sigma-70 family RNA polymerase sigma factor [bacterium]
SGYLATSVVNRVRDRVRQKQRRSTRIEPEPGAHRHPSGPAEALLRSEEAQRINDALAILPYEQQEVLVLRLKADMKFRDIARLQGSPVSTVQRRYYNGLDRLRSMLNDEANQ